MSKNLLIAIILLSIISGIIIAGCGSGGTGQITVPPTVTSTPIPELVNIKGQAFEVNGTPIPNAFIVCVNPGLAASLSTLADTLGNYLFKNLPPGSYRIEIWRSEGDHNSYPGSPIGAVNITVTEGTITVNVTAGTIDPTAKPTVTPVVTNTPTATNIPGEPTNTPVATNTPGGPTNTPTATNTPGGPTNTPTNTPTPLWKNVGNTKFPMAMENMPSLDVYNGTPYLAYQDYADGYGYKVAVMMYNGTNWTSVGNPGVSVEPSLYIYNGMPYIAFGYEANVMMYSGTNWINAGNADFSPDIGYPSLYVYNGSPYVSFEDCSVDNKCTVMMFDGTKWITLGVPGFSGAEVCYTSLSVYNGTPYVAYEVVESGVKVRVMMYNGSTWIPLGTTGFPGKCPSLYISNGTVYLAYVDNVNGGKATVMMYNGTNWVTVGNAGFSAGEAALGPRCCLYVNKDGTPYVAYADGALGWKATVMMYNGTNWVTVGNAGFSPEGASYVSLSVSNEIPYVCYLDPNCAFATVMKFSN